MSFFNEIPFMLIPEHIYNNGRSSDLFRSLITFPPTLSYHNHDPGGKWRRVFKDPGPFSGTEAYALVPKWRIGTYSSGYCPGLSPDSLLTEIPTGIPVTIA